MVKQKPVILPSKDGFAHKSKGRKIVNSPRGVNLNTNETTATTRRAAKQK
jgi:hypothetical protein